MTETQVEASTGLSGPSGIDAGLKPTLVILFVVSLVAAAGNMALQSVMPAIGRAFALSDTLVAGAFSISALLWALSSPLWARLSDRIGRKPVLMIGLTGFTVSMFATGLATHSGLALWCAPVVAFSLMVAGRSAHGLFGSGAPSASQAYLADRTTDTERTSAISVLASAQGVGTVIGPAVAPFFILPLIGLAGPMFAFATLGAVVLWLVWRRLPNDAVEKRARPRPVKRAVAGGLWWDRRTRDFVLYGFLLLTVQASNMSVLGFHVIDEMGRTGVAPAQAQAFIGVAMLAGAAATLMMQWGLIPLLGLRPQALLRYGAGITIVGNLISVMAPSYIGVVLGYAVSSMGLGLARPGFIAGSSLAVSDEEQGDIAGMMVSLAGLSFLGAPMVGVALYGVWTPAPFVANLAILAVATMLALRSAALRDSEQPATAAILAAQVAQPGPGGFPDNQG